MLGGKEEYAAIENRKWNKSRRGFTLVEIIVVLVILAILAAFTIPAMLGYIGKARETKVANAASQIMLAAKAVCTEQYGLNYTSYVGTPDESAAQKMKLQDGSRAGRVTSNMLYRVQQNDYKNMGKSDMTVDIAIATKVLEYLDSSDKSNPTYKFKSVTGPIGTVSEYYNKTGQPGVIIAYLPDGNVAFVEFGWDGYLAHLTGDGTMTVTKNGTFSNYPKYTGK